jgi:hypothetical protein
MRAPAKNIKGEVCTQIYSAVSYQKGIDQKDKTQPWIEPEEKASQGKDHRSISRREGVQMQRLQKINIL